MNRIEIYWNELRMDSSKRIWTNKKKTVFRNPPQANNFKNPTRKHHESEILLDKKLSLSISKSIQIEKKVYASGLFSCLRNQGCFVMRTVLKLTKNVWYFYVPGHIFHSNTLRGDQHRQKPINIAKRFFGSGSFQKWVSARTPCVDTTHRRHHASWIPRIVGS